MPDPNFNVSRNFYKLKLGQNIKNSKYDDNLENKLN